MATTTTSVTITGMPWPFIGVGVPAAQLITAIPSAELRFNAGGVITVAAAGEDQALTIFCLLPNTFTYVLVEAFLRIDGADSDAWDQGSLAQLIDSVNSANIIIPVEFCNSQLAHSLAAFPSRTYSIVRVPTELLIPSGDGDAQFSAQVNNVVTDDAAGTFRFFARFLRYDRNQAQYWPINTPVLTR